MLQTVVSGAHAEPDTVARVRVRVGPCVREIGAPAPPRGRRSKVCARLRVRYEDVCVRLRERGTTWASGGVSWAYVESACSTN